MSEGDFHIKIDKAWLRKNGATWLAILGFGGTSIFNTITGKQVQTEETHHSHDIHAIMDDVSELKKMAKEAENINQIQESRVQKNRDDINDIEMSQNDLKYDVLVIQEDLYGY
jgi:hypothetical protein